ncbi:MAG: hypothetical protein A3G75_07645 [Verrucomicrobia bacterium RIFCSPLOWO2_12_FULL_64_8]|nr:MAG: hypothetical protein A3G75_07645 [Verrucomicrobia bacterium RIFCSPLOWO2_12_FULL_64_8]
MKPATEEFLYFLVWTAELLLRPSWRALDNSFETWAYRQGLSRRLRELERLKLIESRVRKGEERIYRLTTIGRRVALAGVDPTQRWARHWDGHWRLVFFDVPETKNHERVRLRRALRALGFGYLQNSVWLSPDPLENVRSQLAGLKTDVESLTLFEGRPCGGESDRDLVAGAWDFETIDGCYVLWERVADAVPTLVAGQIDPAALRAWATRERIAWRSIVAHDPFLPIALLPAGYRGRHAWERRAHLLNALGKALG